MSALFFNGHEDNVAKIVASRSGPAQVFVRVYAPREPIGDDEPGSWTLIGQPFRSQLVLEFSKSWSRRANQTESAKRPQRSLFLTLVRR